MDNLIKKINLNYQKLETNILKILDPNINYQIKFDKDNNDVIMLFNHDTNELLLTAKYNYIGLYNNSHNTWYWGWSLIKDKKTTEKSKNIKQLSKNNILKSYVSNNNIKINSDEIINLVKMALYSMNDKWYFIQPINHEITQYISIEEIFEKYI